MGRDGLQGLETPQIVGPVIEGIKKAAADAGRPIDADHFGAAFPFRFGDGEDDATRRQIEVFEKRTKRNAKDYFAIGGTDDVIAKLREFVEAGAYKFVLRPIGNSDAEMVEHTRLLIDEVLPAVYADGFASAA